MTHTLELCFELPGDLSLPQTKVPCLSGASCTTPVGSPTCGHMDLHEALDPDPRHRTSTCVAWTRKSQQRSLSYACLGRRSRYWRRRRPICRRRLGHRRQRRQHGGLMFIRCTARNWCLVLSDCMLIQCPQHPYWGFLGRHVCQLLTSSYVQLRTYCAVRHQEQAQATDAQSGQGWTGAASMMSEAEAARSRSIDSSDIEDANEDGDMPERRGPGGTPLPPGRLIVSCPGRAPHELGDPATSRTPWQPEAFMQSEC